MNKFVRALLLLFPLFAFAQSTNSIPLWTREDCENYARTNALSILRQQLQRQNAAYSRTAAWDAFIPRVSADGSKSYAGSGGVDTTGSSSLYGTLPYGVDYAGNVTSDDDTQAWGLEIAKRLWGAGSWSGSMTSVRNAALADESADLYLQYYLRELIESVRLRFHEIIRTRQTHYSNTLRLDQARRNLEVAEANQVPLDIANARYEVPLAEAQVLRSERLIKDALDRLKETLGLDIDYELDTVNILPTSHPTLNVDADLAWVVEQSEDVRRQELAIQSLRNDLTYLQENIGPTISLVGSVGDSHGSSTKEDKGVDQRVALRATWPLGSVGDRAKASIAENKILDAQLELRQIQIALYRQVLDHSRRLVETERQIDVARQRLDIAIMRVELYKDKWDNGEIDILEYVRAQNTVEDCRIELINQETIYFDLLAAYIRLTACDTRGVVY